MVYPVKGHKYLDYGTFDVGMNMLLSERISPEGELEWVDGNKYSIKNVVL